MNILTIGLITIPLFVGFLIYLLPKLDRYFAVAVSLFSAGYALKLFFQPEPITLNLLDNFGVTLQADELSGFFLLTNAFVTLAVILYCWETGKTAFFYIQAIILHGSINAVFICADFISVYVALEVIGIAAFLLISYPRTDRSIWVGLRYLLISNVAMLFYLIGAILVYQTHHSFAFAGLRGSPPEALALIFLGLLTKGGVFVSGLWLPLTHSESETPVSAILSGVVVKTGIFPLIRCALVLEEINPIIRIFGMLTALLGVSYAIFEQDTKRMLALSTISQLGFVLGAPAVAGFFALTHGLVKAALFLIAGTLPSRQFAELKVRPMQTSLWIVVVITSLSISGFPLLSGFGAKVLTLKNLLPWQVIVMNVAAVGTTIAFAKLIFLPHQAIPSETDGKKPQRGFWLAMILLIGGLIGANVVYDQAYTLSSLTKALATIGIGWLAYFLIFQRTSLKLPRFFEQLDQLIGVMTLILILLFWMGFTWLGT